MTDVLSIFHAFHLAFPPLGKVHAIEQAERLNSGRGDFALR
jgi:hypothetical protein